MVKGKQVLYIRLWVKQTTKLYDSYTEAYQAGIKMAKPEDVKVRPATKEDLQTIRG